MFLLPADLASFPQSCVPGLQDPWLQRNSKCSLINIAEIPTQCAYELRRPPKRPSQMQNTTITLRTKAARCNGATHTAFEVKHFKSVEFCRALSMDA